MDLVAPTALEQTKLALLNEYGGFADKRIKSLMKGHSFIVDNRSSRDVGADGKLYGYFCMIFADVVGANQITLTLSQSVPRSQEVDSWAAANALRAVESYLEFEVTPETLSRLEQLAGAFRSIVRPGAPRYLEPAYKYVCPATAASLERLQGVLKRHWSAK